MNTSTEHILQCNQSEPLADASGRIVDLVNMNGVLSRPTSVAAYLQWRTFSTQELRKIK